MKPTMLDRIISILCYYTFGMFSIIWIIFAHVSRKKISSFLSFNLYQAIFVSIILAVISLLYGIAFNLLSVIPFIGKVVVWLDLFFNQTPIYFTFTISGLLITILVLYLSLPCLLGRRPIVPLVSDIVKANFGG